MVSLVINSPSLWRGANYTADVRWQPPARETRHPARADPDKPDASRAQADAQAHSGIGVEHEAERAQTKGRSRRWAGGIADCTQRCVTVWSATRKECA